MAHLAASLATRAAIANTIAKTWRVAGCHCFQVVVSATILDMESDDLKDLVRDCPLLIRMNDGREYFVEKPEFIIVGDYTAGVLIDDEGVKRNAVLTLMNIAAVIPNVSAPRRKRRRKSS